MYVKKNGEGTGVRASKHRATRVWIMYKNSRWRARKTTINHNINPFNRSRHCRRDVIHYSRALRPNLRADERYTGYETFVGFFHLFSAFSNRTRGAFGGPRAERIAYTFMVVQKPTVLAPETTYVFKR